MAETQDMLREVFSLERRRKREDITPLDKVGPDVSTQKLGMGMKFEAASFRLRTLLNELCGGADARSDGRSD